MNEKLWMEDGEKEKGREGERGREDQKENSSGETARDTRLFYTMLLRQYRIVCSHNNLRAHGKAVRKMLAE